MLARRYDQAIVQLRRTLALDERFGYAHWNLGVALYLKGDTAAAIAGSEKARSLDDDPQILAPSRARVCGQWPKRQSNGAASTT